MPQIKSVALQPKLWGISDISTPPPRKTKKETKKLELLSYPHKITLRILTNVCYGSFTESNTLETYILRQFTGSLETVHQQTVIWGLRARTRQIYLSVYNPLCLKPDFSVFNFIYAKRRLGFLWKLILVFKWGFVYHLNNIRLKETNCACTSKQVCRSHIEDMLGSFDRGIGFCTGYNKRETEYHLCTIFKFYAHAQQLKNEED